MKCKSQGKKTALTHVQTKGNAYMLCCGNSINVDWNQSTGILTVDAISFIGWPLRCELLAAMAESVSETNGAEFDTMVQQCLHDTLTAPTQSPGAYCQLFPDLQLSVHPARMLILFFFGRFSIQNQNFLCKDFFALDIAPCFL